MASNFDARLEAGIQFESDLLRMFENAPSIAAVVPNGTEHTHPTFVERLRRLDSDAAKFIRYAPDGVMLKTTNEVIHYDAKAAKAIEREAYNVYMAHRHAGCRVMLFVKYEGIVWYQDIEKIVLVHGSETVEAFPENRRWPVDDDGWICPRMKPCFRATAIMSGTPYREIDFHSMRRWK